MVGKIEALVVIGRFRYCTYIRFYFHLKSHVTFCFRDSVVAGLGLVAQTKFSGK